jgi:hypothetical protein
MNTLNRRLVPAWPFTESLTDASAEDIWVVDGSPWTNTTLLAMPTERPVDGLDEIDGETKKKGRFGD